MKSKLIAFVALVLSLAAIPVFADTKSKEDKIRRLATLGGITTRLDEQVALVLADDRKTEQGMMAQVDANLDVPGSFRPKFDQASKKFVDALQPQWTTFEVIEVFVRAYSPMVSEEDVDAAIAYQSSDAGKRNAAAQMEAANQIGAMVAAREGNRMQLAVQNYYAELRALIQQCNCAKKAGTPGK